eukprot:6207382-Pleurochrysis_carterae.AAC.1
MPTVSHRSAARSFSAAAAALSAERVRSARLPACRAATTDAAHKLRPTADASKSMRSCETSTKGVEFIGREWGDNILRTEVRATAPS